MRFRFPLPILILALLLILMAGPAVADQTISPKEVKQVLTDYLVEQAEQLPGVELRLASLSAPSPFTVPDGRIEFQVIPAKPGVIGSRRLTLMTRVDNRVVDNQSIRVELEALAEVLVAAGNLSRGEVLSETNTSLQQVDITRLRQPIFFPDEIYGKRLKRTVRLGQSLDRSQVDFPPLIKRGDRVEIHAQRGALVLSAVGEARQDGQEQGDSIRVMNSSSRREVICQVVAPGQVKVEF